jgi:hypothetical protein
MFASLKSFLQPGSGKANNVSGLPSGFREKDLEGGGLVSASSSTTASSGTSYEPLERIDSVARRRTSSNGIWEDRGSAAGGMGLRYISGASLPPHHPTSQTTSMHEPPSGFTEAWQRPAVTPLLAPKRSLRRTSMRVTDNAVDAIAELRPVLPGQPMPTSNPKAFEAPAAGHNLKEAATQEHQQPPAHPHQPCEASASIDKDALHPSFTTSTAKQALQQPELSRHAADPAAEPAARAKEPASPHQPQGAWLPSADSLSSCGEGSEGKLPAGGGSNDSSATCTSLATAVSSSSDAPPAVLSIPQQSTVAPPPSSPAPPVKLQRQTTGGALHSAEDTSSAAAGNGHQPAHAGGHLPRRHPPAAQHVQQTATATLYTPRAFLPGGRPGLGAVPPVAGGGHLHGGAGALVNPLRSSANNPWGAPLISMEPHTSAPGPGGLVRSAASFTAGSRARPPTLGAAGVGSISNGGTAAPFAAPLASGAYGAYYHLRRQQRAEIIKYQELKFIQQIGSGGFGNVCGTGSLRGVANQVSNVHSTLQVALLTGLHVCLLVPTASLLSCCVRSSGILWPLAWLPRSYQGGSPAQWVRAGREHGCRHNSSAWEGGRWQCREWDSR